MLYQLSYTSSVFFVEVEHVHSTLQYPRVLSCDNDGATPQNRTGDTVIFSHVLYQLS